MQSPQPARKNYIDLLSEAAEQQAAHPETRSLTSRALAFIASLWSACAARTDRPAVLPSRDAKSG